MTDEHHKTSHHHVHRRRKRPVWQRVIGWSFVCTTVVGILSYLTKGYWRPEENIHIVELAALIITIVEDV